MITKEDRATFSEIESLLKRGSDKAQSRFFLVLYLECSM